MTSGATDLSAHAVLVTGACGFLGEKLAAALLARGAFVVGTDLREAPAAAAEGESFNFVPGGFDRAADEAFQLVSGSGRRETAVLHMAGMAHGGECQEDPAAAFENNVALTFRVLQSCKRERVSKFLFPSTGLVYGDRVQGAVREDGPTAPANFYAASKLAAEALVRGYASYGRSAVVARIGNVYGPGCNPDTVAGTILDKVRRGERISLGDPDAVRDFIYVNDVVEGLIRLLLAVDGGCSTVNLSTGKGTSVRDLAEAACRAAGRQAEITAAGRSRKGQPSRLVLDNGFLLRLTGWRPECEVSAGVAKALKG